MIGETADKYSNLVRMVSDAGHTIGNHSWDHKRMPLLRSASKTRFDLEDSHDFTAISAKTVSSSVRRAEFGFTNRRIASWVSSGRVVCPRK